MKSYILNISTVVALVRNEPPHFRCWPHTVDAYHARDHLPKIAKKSKKSKKSKNRRSEDGGKSAIGGRTEQSGDASEATRLGPNLQGYGEDMAGFVGILYVLLRNGL
jgi:hypothetical protein